ncbi:hypothetical protein ACFL2Q_15505 [Thermodesulfobacteriota bacterium]
MSSDDLKREIEALRTELKELQAQQPRTGDSQPSESAKTAGDQGGESAPYGFHPLAGLQPHLEELIHSLDTELKEIPAATAVAIFALGVLLGRMLSK